MPSIHQIVDYLNRKDALRLGEDPFPAPTDMDEDIYELDWGRLFRIDDIDDVLWGGERMVLGDYKWDDLCSARPKSREADQVHKRRIQFLDGKKRKTIYLGKMSRRHALAIKVKVEALVSAKISGQPFDDETARWVIGLADVLHDKLARVGLVRPRSSATMGAFLGAFIAEKQHLKPRTLRNLEQARDWLLKHLDADLDLRFVTAEDGWAWRRFMLRTLSENTVRSHTKKIKEAFKVAVKRGLLVANPFADLPTTIRSNPQRFEYIQRGVVDAVLAACDDPQWRAIIALCRYGGLRCPSEVLALRWADIDRERERIRVRDNKRERSGHSVREVPLFPELVPHLHDVFDEADDGDEFVITRYRQSNSNLRTQFNRIIRRAGLEPWGKPFQNLRSTRETELAEQFPLHVVTAWLGNTQSVAMEHYLQVTNEHFQRAVRPHE